MNINKRIRKGISLRSGLLILTLVSLLPGVALIPSQAAAAAVAPAGDPVAETQTTHEVFVTTTADSGEGSLREALQNQRPGTVIRFDPVIFPIDAPATIFLETPLPELTTGRVTIDGSDAGVILDGSLLGNEPELAQVDDVSLSFDGGPNLLENGDFSPEMELDHWKAWQNADVDNFRWNEKDGSQEPGCFEWTGTSRQFSMTLIYQLTRSFLNSSGDGSPYSEISHDNFILLDGAQKLDLRFWYRYGNLSANLSFVDDFDQWENTHREFPYAEFWDQAVFQVDVPEWATQVAIELTLSPTRYYTGLVIQSDENVIRGLQVIQFPGSAIEMHNVSGNVIGGANPWMEAGCSGACNLLSGNIESGVMINGGARNVVQGNYIGTDISGTEAMKNGPAGVRIFNSHENQIGGSVSLGEGNLISSNSLGIEINAENEGSVAEGNIIQGNLIGTDLSGVKRLDNHLGIGLGGSSYTLIGGAEPDLRNVISGNVGGISMNGGAHHNTVLGNYIGTDITGLRSLKNNYVGIEMIDGALSNQVGGTEAGEANVISGNGDAGVLIRNFESRDNLVTGNWIGIGADGETSVPNRYSGVYLENTSYNQIGPGNWIANNGDAGVNIHIDGAVNGNTITQNSITNNQAMGIRVYVAEGGMPSTVETLTASKRSVTGIAPAGALLEIYQDAKEEGETYLGTVEADDKGRFSWVAPVGITLSENITVLPTSAGSTGGFSKPAAIPDTFFAEIPGFPGPEQVDFSAQVLLLNSLLALGAMLYFGVVATWFNESLENYSGNIFETVQSFLCKHKLVRCKATEDAASPPLWITLLKWLVILGITAFIQTFITPMSGFDRQWWGQLATLIVSGLLVTGLQIASEWLLRRLSAAQTDVKETEVSGIGLVIALLSVIFSRVLRFGPGLVLGTVDGLYCSPSLTEARQNGQRALAAKAAVAGLTFIGWRLSPLLGQFPGLQSLLVTMFVIGVQYAFFELIPLKVLDGFAVKVWNKVIWALAGFLSLIGFVYINVNPDLKTLSDLIAYKESSLPTLGIVAGVLLLVSFGLMVYTSRFENEEEKQVAEAGD